MRMFGQEPEKLISRHAFYKANAVNLRLSAFFVAQSSLLRFSSAHLSYCSSILYPVFLFSNLFFFCLSVGMFCTVGGVVQVPHNPVSCHWIWSCSGRTVCAVERNLIVL